MFYRTLDVALTELRIRFEGQNKVTSLFSFLYPYNLNKADIQSIENSVSQLLVSYHRDCSEDLIAETRSFLTEVRSEIAELNTVRHLSDKTDVGLQGHLIVPGVTEVARTFYDDSSNCCECREILLEVKVD